MFLCVRSALAAVRCAGIAACVALLAGCTVIANGPAVPAASLGRAPQPVSVKTLERYLLPPEQLNSLIGAKEMFVKNSFSRMYGANTAANDCAATWQVPWGPVYDGNGWTAVRGQYLQGMRPDSTFERKMWQAVVAFPLPVDAQAFYTKQVASWRTCDGRRLNERNLDDPADSDIFWILGDSTDEDATLSIQLHQEGHNDWSCQTALTIRNNVAVNTLVCGTGVKTQAEAVATAIAKKIPFE